MPQQDKPLGVLVRGSGWVAGQHIKGFLNNPHTEIRHIDARTESRIDRYFDEFNFSCDKSIESYEKALERDDIDIVTLCTINYQHAKEAVLAAKAGKHVFIEKPLAMNSEELAMVKEAIEEAGVKSAVGFVCHWYPRIVSMKALVEKNMIGDIFYGQGAYLHEVNGAWKAKAATSGSSLLMGGCHAIDLVRWFMGCERKIKEVFAYANGPFRRKDMDYDPNIFLTMKYEDGAIGQIGSSLECNMPYQFDLNLLGDRGAIRGDKLYSEDLQGAKEFMTIPGIGMDSADVAHHPFDAMLDAFIDWVRGGPKCSSNTQDAIITHQVAFAAEESVRTGKPVSIA